MCQTCKKDVMSSYSRKALSPFWNKVVLMFHSSQYRIVQGYNAFVNSKSWRNAKQCDIWPIFSFLQLKLCPSRTYVLSRKIVICRPVIMKCISYDLSFCRSCRQHQRPVVPNHHQRNDVNSQTNGLHQQLHEGMFAQCYVYNQVNTKSRFIYFLNFCGSFYG